MQAEEAAARAAPSHPNSPRTFATFMRDGAPISIVDADRLIALDHTHPTLTDLRYALGMDLTFGRWDVPMRSGWPIGREPSDEDLAAMLDAMYRGVSSTRIIRADVDGDGLRLSRDEAPIVIREGEHLMLWALADNRSDAEVEFSAEARGEGADGRVEARRTGSLLLDAGPLPAGKYLLPAVIVM